MTKERQLEQNITYVVDEYYNGMMDDPDNYPLMDEEACLKYVKNQIYDMKVHAGGGSCYYCYDICKDLRFLGENYINKKILELSTDILAY